MKLLVSDIALSNINELINNDITYIDLTMNTINNCIGCFSCWVKTPGKCIIRDDAVKIYPLLAQSDNLIYVSKIKYGGYDSIMKTYLERTIPIQQAFIRLYHNETHHIQRNVNYKKATIIAYGDISDLDKKLFEKLISRNAFNMNFESYNIIFTNKDNLEKEVLKWIK